MLEAIQNYIKISTHTPHTGCDAVRVSIKLRRGNFNSHTPHGVRPKCAPVLQQAANFNSHTPHGVRLNHSTNDLIVGSFQLTHPTRGATDRFLSEKSYFYISTHTPHTGCDLLFSANNIPRIISTHTPHTGCDRVGRD